MPQQRLGPIQQISIHALREEGDRRTFLNLDEFGEFLSTPSARRATGFDQQTGKELTQFLSTPSARRATPTLSTDWMEQGISIHALREEGDSLL